MLISFTAPLSIPLKGLALRYQPTSWIDYQTRTCKCFGHCHFIDFTFTILRLVGRVVNVITLCAGEM